MNYIINTTSLCNLQNQVYNCSLLCKFIHSNYKWKVIVCCNHCTMLMIYVANLYNLMQYIFQSKYYKIFYSFMRMYHTIRQKYDLFSHNQHIYSCSRFYYIMETSHHTFDTIILISNFNCYSLFLCIHSFSVSKKEFLESIANTSHQKYSFDNYNQQKRIF